MFIGVGNDVNEANAFSNDHTKLLNIYIYKPYIYYKRYVFVNFELN